MRVFFITLALFFTLVAGAQHTVTFENFNLPADSFLNNAGAAGGFESGAIFLPNDYNPDFDAWEGWAISTTTDTLTPGFTNQYSAIAGGGAEGSDTYAVTFASGPSIIQLQETAAGSMVEGMYITNSTYAYYSMLDGDAFAKKFGGETGEDPDFFRLTIKKYLDGQLSTDSVDFYLADYRFEDNNQDYIVDEWTFVDLSTLGPVDSLQFTLSSTDVGQFGINTPTYFCVDNIRLTEQTTSRPVLLSEAPLELYPNPAVNILLVDWPQEDAALSLINTQGQEVKRQLLQRGQNEVDVQALAPGSYWIQVRDDRQVWRAKSFVKR